MAARTAGEPHKKLKRVARAVYEGDAKIDLDAMAAMGLVPEQELEQEVVECYPDNWTSLQVFISLATQWRVANSGAVTGLHYEVIPGVLDMLGIKKKQRADTFVAMRHMEESALQLFNRKK